MKRFSDFLEGRCWPGYKPKPGKTPYSPGSCEKKNEDVNESSAAAIAAATAIAKKKSGNYDKEGFRKTPYKNPDSPNRKSNDERRAELKEDLRKWFSKTDPTGDWKRINSKGEAIGPCAREPGEPKPKCMSKSQRASLSKKEKASAVRRKRQQDPNAERQGAPINVKNKVNENMEQINEKNKPTNPELWSRAIAQAKSKFDVYPSAYANGWASKWYKSKGGGWESVSESAEVNKTGIKKFKELAALFREDISLDEVMFKKSPYGKTAASQQRAKDLLNPPKESSETKADEKKEVKEDFEQLDEMPGANMDTRAVHSHLKKKGWSLSRTSGGHDVFTHPNAVHHIPVPRHRQLKAPLIKGILKSSQISEETKDVGEYDYEGQMARTQLQTTLRNCEDLIGMINDNDNMPEWVQSKITLAQDYITTVRDYLQSKEELGEEVEQLEEEKQKHTHVTIQDMEFSGHNIVKKGSHMRYVEGSKQMYVHLKNGKPVEKTYPILSIPHHLVKSINEEVEQIDELSKKTLGSYVNKAMDSARELPGSGTNAEASKKSKRFASVSAAAYRTQGLAPRKGTDMFKKYKAESVVTEAVTYEPSPGARPNNAGHTLVGFSFHSDNTKHANIMKHGETGKYYAAGGSSSHPVKSTTFHDTPEDAVKSKKSYVKESFRPMDEPNYNNSIQARQKKADDANKPPFDGPYKKVKGDVKDKSGAVHTAQSMAKDAAYRGMQMAVKKKGIKESKQDSIVRDAVKTDHTTAMKIAKSAARRQAGIKEDMEADNSLGKNDTLAKQSLSRTAGITKDLALTGKNKENVKNKEKFEPEPELSSQIVKS